MRDLNSNGIDDIEEVKTFWYNVKSKLKSFWLFIKENKLILALSVTILLLIGVLAYLIANPKIITKVEEKVVFKDTPEAMMKSKNIMCVNLDDFKATKVTKLKSKVSGKDLIGVWFSREQTTGVSKYIANFELETELKYNKKAYDKIKTDGKEELLKVE